MKIVRFLFFLLLLIDIAPQVFSQSDTLSIHDIYVKKLKENGHKLKVYYSRKDSARIQSAIIVKPHTHLVQRDKALLEIKNGVLISTKQMQYYNLKDKNWNAKQIYSTTENTRIKNGNFQKWHINGSKQVEGKYHFGRKDSIFSFYNIRGKLERQAIYSNGHFLISSTPKFLYDTIKTIRNIISLDVPYLIANCFRVEYERYFDLKIPLKLALSIQPLFTKVASNDLGTAAFIYLTYNLGRADLQFEFHLNRNTHNPVYFTTGIMGMYKYYNKILYKDVEPGNTYSNSLQSESNKIGGIQINFGKKFILGSSKKRIHTIFDMFIGVSEVYIYKKFTLFGNTYASYYPISTPVPLLSTPSIKYTESYLPMMNFGIKIGLGFGK
jgi:hypothetical protein